MADEERNMGSPMNFYKFRRVDFSAYIKDKRPLNIVLIDDSKKDLELIMEILGTECRMRLNFTPFTHIGEAFEHIKNNRNVINLAIIDMSMPTLNGEQVLDKIKTLTKKEELPVVICSSKNNYRNINIVKNLNAHAFFSKPIDGGAFAGFLLGR